MKTPKGKLLIIGGAEDKVGQPPDIIEQMKEFTRYEILSELLPHCKNKKIEINLEKPLNSRAKQLKQSK